MPTAILGSPASVCSLQAKPGWGNALRGRKVSDAARVFKRRLAYSIIFNIFRFTFPCYIKILNKHVTTARHKQAALLQKQHHEIHF